VNAQDIKTKVLHYWRFTRNGYNYISTESGKFKSDILISDEKEIIECEVKISKTDLKNDFKKKKHDIYKKPSKWYSQWIPNKFYFAVPKELTQDAVDLVINTKYGILEVSDKIINKRRKEVYCRIVKAAGVIQPNFKKKLHKQILMRCSSELIRLRIAIYKSASSSSS